MRIAFSLPDLISMRNATLGKFEDATYLLQVPIQNELIRRGHVLSFIGLMNSEEITFTNDIKDLRVTKLTWSGNPVFRFLASSVWRIQRLFRIPYLNVFSTLRLYDVCLQNLPGHDIVYERHDLYKTGVAKAAKKLGLPYVLFFEADELNESKYSGKPLKGLLHWRAKWMMLYNLKLADCVLCVSESGRQHLIRKYRIPSEKILVFPNGVDVEAFNPVRLRQEIDLGFWEKDPIIIFVGNFFQWHDVETLLRSFSMLLKEIPESKLLLVGDGHKRISMENLAKELGVWGSVRFTGAVPHSEIPRLISRSDVAVVPYPRLEQEMWFSPLKLYEYMAAGKAIVATGIGQITQVITDRENGLLVEPENCVSMANAFRYLLQNEDVREHLGNEARSDAVLHHSWTGYVDRLERLFFTLKDKKDFSKI